MMSGKKAAEGAGDFENTLKNKMIVGFSNDHSTALSLANLADIGCRLEFGDWVDGG
jgi:hypothetical protein